MLIQENLTVENLDDIIEELAIVISLADEPDEQTTENLQVVTLSFSSIATSLSDGVFVIEVCLVLAHFEDIHDLPNRLVVKTLNWRAERLGLIPACVHFHFRTCTHLISYPCLLSYFCFTTDCD